MVEFECLLMVVEEVSQMIWTVRSGQVKSGQAWPRQGSGRQTDDDGCC